MAGTVALVVLATSCNSWLSFRGDPTLSGFNPNESGIGPANVASLHEAFTTLPAAGSLEGAPVVDDDIVYVTSTARELLAYDATGVTNCSGSPVRCRPLWRAVLPATNSMAPPTLSGGFVYAITGGTGDDGELLAFRAGAGNGCAPDAASGVPTCTPVWQADVASSFGAPTIADGRLYVSSEAEPGYKLKVFDAAGVAGCGGSPVMCEPLWTAAGGGAFAPAVADGRVYVTNQSGRVDVYDAAGQEGCTGSPTVCTALWSTATPPAAFIDDAFSALVVGGVIVVHKEYWIRAFDASGSAKCAGVPKVCEPLWSANTAYQRGFLSLAATAYGQLYVPTDYHVEVYDLTGATGCSGSPKVCAPNRRIQFGGAPGSGNQSDWLSRGSSLTIANGVGFIGLGWSGNGRVVAFDARSTANCGGAPLVCPILWSNPFGAHVNATPAVVNGRLYVGTSDGVLHVFARPA